MIGKTNRIFIHLQLTRFPPNKKSKLSQTYPHSTDETKLLLTVVDSEIIHCSTDSILFKSQKFNLRHQPPTETGYTYMLVLQNCANHNGKDGGGLCEIAPAVKVQIHRRSSEERKTPSPVASHLHPTCPSGIWD